MARFGLRHSARTIGLAALCIFFPGCVAALAVGAATGYGAVQYAENGASQDFHTDLDQTWNATLVALRELGYPVAESVAHGPSGGVIEVNDAWVKVARHPGAFTRVRIRIGTFDTSDNRRRAELLLDAVADRIGPA